MNEITFVVEEAPEGGYTTRALGYPIFTEAGTWEGLKEYVQEAVRTHFDDGKQPRIIRLHLVKEEVVTL